MRTPMATWATLSSTIALHVISWLHVRTLHPSYTWRELLELYRFTQPARNLKPRYNIAPTTVIDAVKW